MRIATDIGGTFTDLVGIKDDGSILIEKSATTGPNFEQGIINVINKSNIDPTEIESFIHGTTIVINSLTEKKGAKTGLITTKGFRDVLEIARGNRPDLFNLNYKKPTPFVERHLRREVSERLNYKGEVIKKINESDIKDIAEYFRKEDVEAVAISFLFSFINPAHELKCKKLIQELLPHVEVTASHEISKEWREYERTNTAVLNSFVKPLTKTYLDKMEIELDHINLVGKKLAMQSNGGTTSFNNVRESPINLVESGPVGGIYGASIIGEQLNEKNIIAFDVGGTTAKCSLIENGNINIGTDYYIDRNEKFAGYPIKVPVVDVLEIGNGGGSIAWVDKSNTIKVGPKSAGSIPGPIAYGNGGEQPTITDANLLTGRLSPEYFKDIDIDKIRRHIKEDISNRLDLTPEECALGIIRISNSNMLNALKSISTRRGYNPQDFVMVAFGGGGGLHATRLANELGVKKLVIPKASAVFSAWGMLMSDYRFDEIQTFIINLKNINDENIDEKWKEMESKGDKYMQDLGVDSNSIKIMRYADMRYKGQEHTVKVSYPSTDWDDSTLNTIKENFHSLHKKKYTYDLPDNEIEIMNLHITVLGLNEHNHEHKQHLQHNSKAITEKGFRKVLFEDDGWVDSAIYDRSSLHPGMNLKGPAIVEDNLSSIIVYGNQTLEVDNYENLIIKNSEG